MTTNHHNGSARASRRLGKQRRWLSLRLLRPRFLFTLVIIVTLVVLLNAVISARRIRSGLLEASGEKAVTLIKVLEATSRRAIEANSLLERLLADRLVTHARLLDLLYRNREATPQELRQVAKVEGLADMRFMSEPPALPAPLRGFPFFPRFTKELKPIEIRQQPGGSMSINLEKILGGNRERSEKARPNPLAKLQLMLESQRRIARSLFRSYQNLGIDEVTAGFGKIFLRSGEFGVAVKRRYTPGAIVILVDTDYILEHRKSVGVQGLISELSRQESIDYISLQDDKFNILAHSGPEKLGKIEVDPWLREVMNSGRTATRIRQTPWGGEILEVAHASDTSSGLLGRNLYRVGLTLKHTEAIWRKSLASNLIYAMALLLVGTMAVVVVSAGQDRQLHRTRAMEEEADRNERLISLGTMAAGVDHEIRNPLNTIGIGLQRLTLEFSPTGEGEADDYRHMVRTLRGEVSRLNRIVNDFLMLSRPSKMEPVEVGADELVGDVVALMEPEGKAQGVSVRLHIPESLPMVNADRNQMRQALMNIIQNGYHAMASGGVLTITAEVDDETLLLHFEDSGPGLDEETERRLFEPFFTTRKNGTGLGLAITKHIITSHGGRIWAVNNQGPGATFTVELPLA